MIATRSHSKQHSMHQIKSNHTMYLVRINEKVEALPRSRKVDEHSISCFDALQRAFKTAPFVKYPDFNQLFCVVGLWSVSDSSRVCGQWWWRCIFIIFTWWRWRWRWWWWWWWRGFLRTEWDFSEFNKNVFFVHDHLRLRSKHDACVGYHGNWYIIWYY